MVSLINRYLRVSSLMQLITYFASCISLKSLQIFQIVSIMFSRALGFVLFFGSFFFLSDSGSNPDHILHFHSLSHCTWFSIFGCCNKHILSNSRAIFSNSPICYQILSFSLNMFGKIDLAVMHPRKCSLYLNWEESSFKSMTTDLKWPLNIAQQSSHICTSKVLKRPHCIFSLLRTSITTLHLPYKCFSPHLISY